MAIVVLLTTAGCSSSGSDEPDGGSTASGTPSTDPSASESVTGLPEPTETAEAATGPELEVEGIRVRAPEGWKKTYDTFVADTAQGTDGALFLSVAGTGSGPLSLKEAESYFWTRNKRPEGYESQEQTSLGGVSANFYTSHDRFDDYLVVNTWDAGYAIQVMLRMNKDEPDDLKQELLDSVLASYEGPRA